MLEEEKKDLAVLLMDQITDKTARGYRDIDEFIDIWKKHTRTELSEKQIYEHIYKTVMHLYTEDKLAAFR